MQTNNNSAAPVMHLSLTQAIGSSGALFCLIIALCIGSWSAAGISVLLPRATAFANAGARANAERRIMRRLSPAANVNAENLSQVLAQRSVLLKRSLVVTLTSGAATVAVWTRSLADHPSWVEFEVGPYSSGQAVVSAERIRQHLILVPIEHVTQPTSCRILGEWTDLKGVLRAQVHSTHSIHSGQEGQADCIAESGFAYDVDDLSLLIKHAFEAGTESISYELTAVAATITASGGTGSLRNSSLSLLATGQSNFKGSGNGRKANVRKGLHERVNNVIVPMGATFSFNDTLGTVSIKNGWQMALTIFNGKDLAMAPGGGICQVSTTVFRAALAAGFPIFEHRSHSLYVAYYEKYGVGLDATIYPGHQNLTFLNDTPGPILIQSYHRDDDAFVRVYGIDDHRSVTMSGPYFQGNAPQDVLVKGRPVRGNEIAWQRDVTRVSGEPLREVFSAHYLTMPKSLSKKWQPTVTQVRDGNHIARVATVVEAN